MLVSSKSTLRGTVFIIVCMITLLGSSFRPSPGPVSALGTVDPSMPMLQEDTSAEQDTDPGLYYSSYVVQKGDTISGIADSFDVSTDTIVSFNSIQNARSLRPGQTLKIPSMSGILYTARPGDTAEGLAKTWEISRDRIVVENGLLSEKVSAGRTLFLPDASMPKAALREVTGDLFHRPIRGYTTSWFGWRRDPFSGRTTFHSAMDIGAPTGTPIGAAQEGRVKETGYSPITGRYVVLSHGGGWTSFYGHMKVIYAKEGEYYGQGETIGLVGNTGYSTGPHLHFALYKNGKAVNPNNYLK